MPYSIPQRPNQELSLQHIWKQIYGFEHEGRKYSGIADLIRERILTINGFRAEITSVNKKLDRILQNYPQQEEEDGSIISFSLATPRPPKNTRIKEEPSPTPQPSGSRPLSSRQQEKRPEHEEEIENLLKRLGITEG